MNAKLVDYSERYFREVRNIELPSKRSGKFVRIRSDEGDFIVLSSAAYSPYHADIVRLFCAERGLTQLYDDSKKSGEILDPGWEVAGGGKFELDEASHSLRLYGESMAYGKFASPGLQGLLGSSGKARGYTVIIE